MLGIKPARKSGLLEMPVAGAHKYFKAALRNAG